MGIRDITADDLPALQAAIDRDTFHPGEWKVEDFANLPPEEGAYHPAVHSQVIENANGPVAFVRFTKVLRISCVWNDADDTSRNAKAIISGIRHAVEMGRSSGFSELIITSDNEKLSNFLVKILGMTKRGSEHLLLL